MMKITPIQRMDETRSPRNHMAAKVANTKLKAVSGQRKLISLRDIKTSRHTKNNASKNTPSRICGFVAPALQPEDFGGRHAVHVADLVHAFFQQDDAGGLKDESDTENQQ